MKIQNVWTEEVQEVSNVFQSREGEIIYRISSRPGAKPGQRFFEEHPQFKPGTHNNADGWQILYLDSSWKVVSNTKEATPAKAEESPKPETKPAPKAQPTPDEDAMQLAAILGRMKGGQIDESRVIELIKAELEKQDTRKVEYQTPWSSNIVEGCKIKDFDDICAWVMQGEQVNIHQFPNFSATGSVMGMKNLYYGLDSKLVRCGAWIYNVTSEPRIYDELAY